MVIDREVFDLGILPTAGVNADGTIPEAGLKRIRMVFDLVKSGGIRFFVIIGGERNSWPSEALVYHNSIVLACRMDIASVDLVKNVEALRAPNFSDIATDPDLAARIRRSLYGYEALATCTNRDLAREQIIKDFAEKYALSRESMKIGFVSHIDHCDRALSTLLSCGYQNVWAIESGEAPGYPLEVERFLSFITSIDPAWRSFGLPLAALAYFRLFKRITYYQ